MSENKDEQKDAFDEQSIGEKRIDAQCFLNRNYEAVYRAYNISGTNTVPKVNTWDNFRAVTGPPDKVIAKLASACKKKPLNNKLTTAMLSALVPKLKLYKMEIGEGNVVKSETEIIFPEFFEESTQMFRDRQGRGFGAGLSSFTFDYNGKNPAEVDSLIECEMKLAFSSMSDLFQDRGGFTFADLISKPKLKTKTGARNDKYFRIKAVVGYHVPNSDVFNTSDGKEIKKIISRFHRVFTLELIKHNLDFKEDGRVTLTIEYMAATDRVMSDGDSSNVFVGFLKRKSQLSRLDTEIKRKFTKSKVSTKKCDDPKVAKEERERDYPKLLTLDSVYVNLTEHIIPKVKIIKAHVNNVYGTEIIDSRTNTRKRLRFENKIDNQTKELLDKRMKRAMELPEKADREKHLKAILDADDDSIKSYFGGDEKFFESGEKTLAMDVTGLNEVVIKFFRFGDLLDAALNIMHISDEDYKDVKFLIGSIPVRLDSGGSGSGIQYNNYRLVPISELFVSFDLYVEYVLKNIILKGKKVYPLKRFIKDMFDNLIANMYSPRCFEGDGDHGRSKTERCNDSGMVKPTFGMEIFTLEANGKADPLGGQRRSKGGTPLNAATMKTKNYNTNPDSQDLITYYYIYGKHPDSTEKLTRNETEDSKRGIYHLAAGQETGFVKSIKFKKTDVKFQKEARMTSDGTTSSSALITERYNADVTMFGNNLFRPGMMIYINPDSFGVGSTNIKKQANSTIKRSVGDALGIGGYYRVIKVRNKIESGKFETELECSWVSNGTGAFNDKCKIDPSTFDNPC